MSSSLVAVRWGKGSSIAAPCSIILPNARPIPVLGPEDTILQKLRRYREGGEVSERQWRDVVAVLRNEAGAIDDAFLDAVAASDDLTALLARARDAATER